MKTKHTPGPWKLDDSGEGLISESGERIAMWATDCGDEITPGNLKLIAAAPELLEACITLIQQAEICNYHTCDRLHALLDNLAIKEIRAAIKKATE